MTTAYRGRDRRHDTCLKLFSIQSVV